MLTTVRCPHCFSNCDLPEHAARGKVRCTACQKSFTIDQSGAGQRYDAELQPLETDARRPAKPAWDRYSNSKNAQQNLTKLILIGLVGLLVLGFGVWEASSFFAGREVKDGDWQTFEKPLFTVSFPGKPSIQSQMTAGVPFVMANLQPNRNCVFTMAWTEGDLPPARKNVPSDRILSDACNGAVGNVPGAKEESRRSISLDGYPGKEIVMSAPKMNGKMIVRIYLVNGRMVMAMSGGKDYTPDHQHVQKFLGSLRLKSGKGK